MENTILDSKIDSKFKVGEILTIMNNRKIKVVKITDIMTRRLCDDVSYVYGFVEQKSNGRDWSVRTNYLEEYQFITVTNLNY